jgi:5-methylcytosine-specific restriction enzyme subunit McrC
MTQSEPEHEDAEVTAAEACQASVATDGGIPIRNIWHMLLYAWDQPDRIGAWRADVESAPSLDALMAAILTNLIEQRLRIGLGRDYANHIDEIPAIRGRLLFGETIRRTSLLRAKTVCRYHVFTPDVPKNQFVRSVLAQLVEGGHFGSSLVETRLRGRLRRVVREMDAARVVAVHPDDVAREQHRRHDRDYSLMLAICRLILARSMPTERQGLDHAPSISRDSFRLHHIYEKFVARFYELHLVEWLVQTQPRWKWPVSVESSLLPCMRPDIVLEHRESQRLVVIDTKFTPHSLTLGQWGNLTYSRDHLFQIYAYLKSQESRSPHFAAATGVLLYPSAKHELSDRVQIDGHLMRWETVDLSQPWQCVEARLLALP